MEELSAFQKIVCADIARGRITDFRTFFELYRDQTVGSTKPFIGATGDPKLFKSRNDALLYEVLRELIALLRSLERDGLVFLEQIEGKKMIRMSVPAQDIRLNVHLLLQKFQKTEIVPNSKLKNFVAKGCQETAEAQAKDEKSASNSIPNYVAKSRIEELQAITNASFDLKKLIQLCIEINTARKFDCILSIAMILRAIIDHVPPIFGAKSFAEVANNYENGKSFKELMLRLDTSSRKIADSHLHNQIRKREALPTFNQVNFSAELDVLLAEIINMLD